MPSQNADSKNRLVRERHTDPCLSLSRSWSWVWFCSGQVQLLLSLRQFVLQPLLPPVQKLPARAVRLPARHEPCSEGDQNGGLQCSLRDISHVHTLSSRTSEPACVYVCYSCTVSPPTLLQQAWTPALSLTQPYSLHSAHYIGHERRLYCYTKIRVASIPV